MKAVVEKGGELEQKVSAVLSVDCSTLQRSKTIGAVEAFDD